MYILTQCIAVELKYQKTIAPNMSIPLLLTGSFCSIDPCPEIKCSEKATRHGRNPVLANMLMELFKQLQTQGLRPSKILHISLRQPLLINCDGD